MDYQVIVVGGGHAGLEAAMASANLDAKTLLLTLNIKMMGNMPCNPSIGGSAKGIVVREIDALGGKMGLGADHTYLQMKMLNTGKGPAVQCLRAQADKKAYPAYMQKMALETKNLTVREASVFDLLHDDERVFGVILGSGEKITSEATILTTGTFMEATILRGHEAQSGGPDGEAPSLGLSPNLAKMGIELIRLKTGTPPRIKKDSIDFSKMVPQEGSAGHLAFSYDTDEFIPLDKQELCYLIYTQPETHAIIHEHIKDSALFSGLITGVGPRYCPSIEDKIVRFADKSRHQLFLEPESRYTDSMYLQGFSTSMPIEVQEKMVRSLPGLEKAVFLKYAYAIEYDALVPTQFFPTLELKRWPGLYGAGQIIGTSGYEEAAGLGLLAGINAVMKIQGREPVILRRDQAYIGVMIDDLVTKGTQEPYRLLSSRAEYRLLMRHDNADLRLTELGHKIGLIPQDRYDRFRQKSADLLVVLSLLKKTNLKNTPALKAFLEQIGSPVFVGSIPAVELLKRPEIGFNDLVALIPDLQSPALSETGVEQLEVMVKFEGYIQKQIRQAERQAKQEAIAIPEGFKYADLDGLALEARQKLQKIQPRTIGQAGRISGVNPSDIAMLVLYLKRGN
jgi:tRNA uridine 5-carboxymethylaminomethyl modification enzyme